MTFCLPTKMLLTTLILSLSTHGAETPIEYTSMGSLKTRDKVIEIHAGEQSPLYTVKTLNGKLLARHLSYEMLAQQFPELREIVERGIADDASLYSITPIDTGASRDSKLNTGR